MSWIDKPFEALASIPPGSLARRFAYAALLGVGLTMTMYGSFFVGSTGPIPFRFIPDVRPVISMATGLLAGLYAAGGGASRRGMALWTTVVFVMAFHLEEATVHWIGPFPGSLTGTRIGILGTAGSLLALGAVLLLHVEVERGRLAADLAKRGADAASATQASARLASVGARRVVGVMLGVAGIGLLVVAGERLFGDNATGGAYILVVGGAMLLALALLLGRAGKRSGAAPEEQADAREG